MGRLSLVLADGDTEYLSKLERFLIANYPQRFEIISFASREKLLAYLSGTEKADILLINNEMFKGGLITAKGAKSIVLVGDGAAPAPTGYETVLKYQHADRLVADILRLYSAGELRSSSVSGQHRTRIVCVCSPFGGTGKSSIAAGCSILCESRGLRTFYLDLEAVPSTEMFFQSGSGQSFSNVIFHLKGRNDNLSLQLEGASSMDSKTGVHFFRPPENLLEMNELTAQDTTLLMDAFSKSLAYDMVFIDTDGGFSPLNTTILIKSDIILVILTPGQASSIRTTEFMNCMEYIKANCNGSFGKIITVLNRSARDKSDPAVKEYHAGKEDPVATDLFDEYDPMVRIDECTVPASGSYPSVLTGNITFLSGISGLLDYLTPGGTTPVFMNGGGSIAS